MYKNDSETQNNNKQNYIDQIYNKIYGSGLFFWLVALPVGLGYAVEISYNWTQNIAFYIVSF